MKSGGQIVSAEDELRGRIKMEEIECKHIK